MNCQNDAGADSFLFTCNPQFYTKLVEVGVGNVYGWTTKWGLDIFPQQYLYPHA